MQRPAIYGHRGGAPGPPNSSEAVRHAATQLADGVEIDVQLTDEGTLIARHDPPHSRRPSDADDFDAVLAATQETGLHLLIDFKSRGAVEAEVEALVSALAPVERRDSVSVSSFSLPFLERFRSVAPGFDIYPIVSLRQNFPIVRGLDQWTGVSVLAAAAIVNPFLLWKLRGDRRKLLVWFGATEWRVLIWAARLVGAEAVIVRQVDRAVNTLGQGGAPPTS